MPKLPWLASFSYWQPHSSEEVSFLELSNSAPTLLRFPSAVPHRREPGGGEGRQNRPPACSLEVITSFSFLSRRGEPVSSEGVTRWAVSSRPGRGPVTPAVAAGHTQRLRVTLSYDSRSLARQGPYRLRPGQRPSSAPCSSFPGRSPPTQLLICMIAKEKELCAPKPRDSNKMERDKNLEAMWFPLMCFSPYKLPHKQSTHSPEVFYCTSRVCFLKMFPCISQLP